MKIIFLLPPSEGKNNSGEYKKEDLSFIFDKPIDIAVKVTEKDIKCTGNRFLEGLELNKNIENGPFDLAINRYSGVMYNSINYHGMDDKGKSFFENNFLILSGMYGLLKPLDIIGNYKLPIEAKGLLKFWGDKVTNKLIDIKPSYIVNLLPISYQKMINFNILDSKIININFLKSDLKKISHGVKKLRGEWVKNICDNNIINYNDFGTDILKSGNIIDVNIIIS